jgi:hypothetical protein
MQTMIARREEGSKNRWHRGVAGLPVGWVGTFGERTPKRVPKSRDAAD